jgi:hypothetical protein
MADKADVFVLITGVVRLHTSLGAYLDIGERRNFVPQFYTRTLVRLFVPGESVSLQVVRSFAEEEKLIA